MPIDLIVRKCQLTNYGLSVNFANVTDNSETMTVAHIAYYRVSTKDQSIEAQRHAMAQGGPTFAKEFQDEGVSGTVPAKDRPGFAQLLAYVREGDTVHVFAIDRLGRDALDVQATVRGLIDKGVIVDVCHIGPIQGDAGKLILAVLAQLGEIEKARIAERTSAGREKAKADGTHLGRPPSIAGEKAAQALLALAAEGATVAGVAQQFGISRQALMRLRDSDAAHAQRARELAAEYGIGPIPGRTNATSIAGVVGIDPLPRNKPAA